MSFSSGFFPVVPEVDRDHGDLEPAVAPDPNPDHQEDMAEREDNVYKAKLAEQAERYDGKSAKQNRQECVIFLGVDFLKVLIVLT